MWVKWIRRCLHKARHILYQQMVNEVFVMSSVRVTVVPVMTVFVSAPVASTFSSTKLVASNILFFPGCMFRTLHGWNKGCTWSTRTSRKVWLQLYKQFYI